MVSQLIERLTFAPKVDIYVLGIPQIVPPLLERSIGDPPPPYPGRPLSIPSIPPPQYHE